MKSTQKNSKTNSTKAAPAKAAPAKAAPAKAAPAKKAVAPKSATTKVAKTTKSNKAESNKIERPVRNRTAYMMFVKDHRRETQTGNPDMDFVAVTKDIAARWGALTEAQRKPFHERAAADKVRYEREVAHFRQQHPGEALTIKKKKRVAKLKGPKKARSAYVFYTKEVRQSIQEKNPDFDFGSVTKQIATAWNALTAAQKSKYEKQAEEDRSRFEAENATFNTEHPEVKRRKLKAKKNAPKKARSAYLFFTMEKRAGFKSANPDKDFGGLTKLVADDWKKLSAAQKKKYEKLAEDDRKRYDGEMKNYKRPTDEELDADEPRKAKKPHTGPKRPRSAYLFYTQSERAKVAKEENNNEKFTEITQRIANSWKSLSAREKSKFEDQAKEDQARYKRECSAVVA